MASENNRKRKNGGDKNGPQQASIINDDIYHDLSLSLSFPPPPFMDMNHGLALNTSSRTAMVHQVQPRRSYGAVRIARNAASRQADDQENEFIDPPYPWATNRRATVHSLEFLLSNGITVISGEVKCKKCSDPSTHQFDLKTKFREIALFIIENKGVMHDRAPDSWTNPELPACRKCGPNSLKPLISTNKENINWLFLFLGQLLGMCTLEQLKYFCRYTKNHRTGAKDRVLYLTYLELCRQLDPACPF